MDRTVKIILSVIAGLFVVCVCVSIAAALSLRRAGETWMTAMNDPTQNAAVGQKIADYTLPPGYSQVGMHILNIDMVIITSEDGTSLMQYILMQFPSNEALPQEEIREQMLQQFEQQSTGSMRDTQVIDEFTETILGQEVQFIIVEGTTSGNIRMRQMYGFFEGKGGQAMLTATGDPSSWDQEKIDAFIATFK